MSLFEKANPPKIPNQVEKSGLSEGTKIRKSKYTIRLYIEPLKIFCSDLSVIHAMPKMNKYYDAAQKSLSQFFCLLFFILVKNCQTVYT